MCSMPDGGTGGTAASLGICKTRDSAPARFQLAENGQWTCKAGRLLTLDLPSVRCLCAIMDAAFGSMHSVRGSTSIKTTLAPTSIAACAMVHQVMPVRSPRPPAPRPPPADTINQLRDPRNPRRPWARRTRMTSGRARRRWPTSAKAGFAATPPSCRRALLRRPSLSSAADATWGSAGCASRSWSCACGPPASWVRWNVPRAAIVGRVRPAVVDLPASKACAGTHSFSRRLPARCSLSISPSSFRLRFCSLPSSSTCTGKFFLQVCFSEAIHHHWGMARHAIAAYANTNAHS